MNTKKDKVILPKNITINPALADKYNDEPLFKEKVEKANRILEATGIPKFNRQNEKSVSSNLAEETTGKV